MANAIMIQGTASNAGKSLLAAGLCRIFAQDGYKVAPFKSQNMALNSAITPDGFEMGRAQVVQAEAAGVAPDVRMNPILLKPTSHVGSQVIVNGVPRGTMPAGEYFRYRKSLIPEVMAAYESLAAEYDIIVIEGAGSPAEINLKSDDIVNMGMAKLAGAPVLLAGDIDRGGVFASLYGTVALLEAGERAMVKGTVINKFRGDAALLRPGRFDRRITIDRPNLAGRIATLQVHTRNIKLAEDVDLKQIARGTAGFTGADLENLLNEAALLAGRRNESFITMKDLQESIIKVIAGPEKHSRVIPERERRLTAYHEAGHAVVMHALPDLDPVHQITIVPRGEAGGMTIYLPDEDRSYLSRSYMLDRIAGLLGGRAAEQLVLGDISTGASNDISRATQLARKMVGTYGMSEQLGNVAFDAGHDEVFIGKSMAQTRPYSEKTAAEMDGEIRRIMDDAYARCTAILEQYRPQLVEVAEYLLANETMTAEEFEKVFRTE